MGPASATVLMHTLAVAVGRVVVGMAVGLQIIVIAEDAAQRPLNHRRLENLADQGNSGQNVVSRVSFLIEDLFVLREDLLVEAGG